MARSACGRPTTRPFSSRTTASWRICARATSRWSAELGCLVRIHAAQGAQEVAFLREWYGKGPIELLDSVGLLGRRVSSPHGRFVSPAELTRLAETGTTIVHCPLTSIRHGHVLESFERYRAAVTIEDVPPGVPELDYLRGAELGQLLRREAMATAWALTEADRPNFTISIPTIDAAILGEFFYLYELQTVMAGALLNVNPFGQPGVEAGKNATYALMGREGYEGLRGELLATTGDEARWTLAPE